MTEKQKAPPDQELSAIRRILAILEGIPETAWSDVMWYVSQRVRRVTEREVTHFAMIHNDVNEEPKRDGVVP